MYGAGYKLEVKGKTHDLNHDLTFSAHTINCVCHSIRSMFRVLGTYNFVNDLKVQHFIILELINPLFHQKSALEWEKVYF